MMSQRRHIGGKNMSTENLHPTTKIGGLLRQKRLADERTTVEVAGQLRLEWSTYMRYEAGDYVPSHCVEMFADYLSVHVGTIRGVRELTETEKKAISTTMESSMESLRSMTVRAERVIPIWEKIIAESIAFDTQEKH